MPPKARITARMIVEAGLKIVRSEGSSALNVRRTAAELNCSTQPVMYHYRTVSELVSAVYEEADRFHTEYIMTPSDDSADPLLSTGMRYIRFAYEEKNLFRFLFRSGKFGNTDLKSLVCADELSPMIGAVCAKTGLTDKQAKEAFEVLFVCVHGAASILADNDMVFDEAHYEKMLKNIFIGITGVLRGEVKC